MLAGFASSDTLLSLATQGGDGAATPPSTWPLFLGLFAIVYFLMLRPQMKEQKKRRETLSSLKKDDKVVTTSGMLGQIVAIDDHHVTLKVDDNVRIRFLRAAVDRRVEEEPKST